MTKALDVIMIPTGPEDGRRVYHALREVKQRGSPQYMLVSGEDQKPAAKTLGLSARETRRFFGEVSEMGTVQGCTLNERYDFALKRSKAYGETGKRLIKYMEQGWKEGGVNIFREVGWHGPTIFSYLHPSPFDFVPFRTVFEAKSVDSIENLYFSFSTVYRLLERKELSLADNVLKMGVSTNPGHYACFEKTVLPWIERDGILKKIGKEFQIQSLHLENVGGESFWQFETFMDVGYLEVRSVAQRFQKWAELRGAGGIKPLIKRRRNR